MEAPGLGTEQGPPDQPQDREPPLAFTCTVSWAPCTVVLQVRAARMRTWPWEKTRHGGLQSLRERVGEGSKGFNHHPARASRGSSVQSTAEAGVDLDGSQPPPPACGGGGQGQGGVKGLCVGKPGLKSSYKETSSWSGEPVTQKPALGRLRPPPKHRWGRWVCSTPPLSHFQPATALPVTPAGGLEADPGGGRAHPLPLAPAPGPLTSLQLHQLPTAAGSLQRVA